MTAFAQLAQTPADNGLPAPQEQLLAAAIYAAAVRTRIDQACSADERYALIDQLERAETFRQVLERQVAELESMRKPWWRRILAAYRVRLDRSLRHPPDDLHHACL